MLTRLYPMVQFKKDTWELDEFDCASIFLLIGREKAMVIDTGIGIGDLKGAIEQITDKPLIVVITHGHIGRTGNAPQFHEIWMNAKDSNYPIPDSTERRRDAAMHSAIRHKGIYAYDLKKDIIDHDTSHRTIVHDLYDGQQFDLGGRIVTIYECPGHTQGEIIILDENTRCLFVGDAINYNLGLASSGVTIETAVKYLEKMRDMRVQYDGIYNGHHDFRPLGMPLGEDCLPNAIDLCYELISGKYTPVTVLNKFLGRPDRVVVIKDKNMIAYAEDKIHNRE